MREREREREREKMPKLSISPCIFSMSSSSYVIAQELKLQQIAKRCCVHGSCKGVNSRSVDKQNKFLKGSQQFQEENVCWHFKKIWSGTSSCYQASSSAYFSFGLFWRCSFSPKSMWLKLCFFRLSFSVLGACWRLSSASLSVTSLVVGLGEPVGKCTSRLGAAIGRWRIPSIHCVGLDLFHSHLQENLPQISQSNPRVPITSPPEPAILVSGASKSPQLQQILFSAL